MNDVSKKLRVLSATQVKQSAGGVAIKAGVRAGLAISSATLSTSLTDTTVPTLDPSGPALAAAKM